MHLIKRVVLSLIGLVACLGTSRTAVAQDLYDPAVLRTINLQFHDANWLALLRSNYSSETLILADLTIDGTTYLSVGVRIRGNTSYTALPAGSNKFSLKVEADFVDPEQQIMGFEELNLNNGFRDPTFSREVVYNNYVAQFIPNPRANNVVVTLNGENWGVYINVQQPDKRMLRNYFSNADGVRIGCSNNPNGPGLSYAGTNPTAYSAYQVNNDGGLADPLSVLIAVTNALSNTPLANWDTIDTLFAIDPSIWSVVLENILTDDDSYINKGCDFMTYRDPIDSRLHLIQRDANETFTQTNWAFDRNFTSTNKPVLSRLLAVPQLRQRYLAHYRTALRDLSWTTFEPVFTARRTLLDAAVQLDTKKLYSYQLFQNNFTATVTLPYSGLAGGTLIGLQPFFTQRATFLNARAELVAAGPTISSAQASNALPTPGQPVWITAAVAANGNAIANVELFYRPSPSGVYQRVLMSDSGTVGDGAAGDGVYGALLPVAGSAGQRVSWYVGATAANTYISASFLPELTERAPRSVQYGVASTPGMRITEWMYSGINGEFIEFTNLSTQPIDMAGWSMDDDHAQPGAFALGSAGIVQPGESVVLTESTVAAFRTAWSLGAQVKIVGELGVTGGNSLARGDQIHLFDASGSLIDRLYYDDRVFTGSVRTQNASGQPTCSAIGQNDVVSWLLSTVGDAFGSVASAPLVAGGPTDVGTPGSFNASCSGSPVLFADGFE